MNTGHMKGDFRTTGKLSIGRWESNGGLHSGAQWVFLVDDRSLAFDGSGQGGIVKPKPSIAYRKLSVLRQDSSKAEYREAGIAPLGEQRRTDHSRQ